MSLVLWEKAGLQPLLAKIMVLQLLNHTPSPPTENLHPGLSATCGTSLPRVLSIMQEKQLVETLALLASTTDDPSKVVALGIEEDATGDGMTITMAVNNGGLESVRTGFETLAIILQKICDEGDVQREHQAELLRAIVAMNQNRILCRLRSRHATLRCNFKRDKSDRPKTLPMLVQAFDNIPRTRKYSVLPNLEHRVRAHVQSLGILFDQLEALSASEAKSRMGLEILVLIVETSRQLHSTKVLPATLDLHRCDPSTKNFVTHTITKLGRYSTSSTFLCQAAERYPIFSNFRVTVVKLPAMPMSQIKDANKLFADVTKDLQQLHESTSPDSDPTLRLRNKTMKQSDICEILASTKFVVHAEIQLLAHYESQNSARPPRIICSTKKACFLCNLFIGLHGQYFIPSTHGKFYEKWSLPDNLKVLSGGRAKLIMSTIERLSAILDKMLQHEMLSAGKLYPPPNESIINGSPILSELARSMHTPEQLVDSGYECGEKEMPQNDPETDKSFTQGTIPAMTYSSLPKGQLVSFELSRGQDMVKVSTPCIHLTFSYESWTRSTSSLHGLSQAVARRGCDLKLRWLSDVEVAAVGSTIVDLHRFPRGSERTIDELAGSLHFYVKRGSDIISVQTCYW